MEDKFTGLSRKLNAAILTMVSNLLPMGYDVSNNAPDTYERLVEHVNKTGRILVWSGASETTIYGDCEINYAFRAWHDFVHFTHKLGFSVLDEIEVCIIQCDQLVKHFGNSLEIQKFISYLQAEIIGQAQYEVFYGEFPIDQCAFVVDYIETGKIHRKF